MPYVYIFLVRLDLLRLDFLRLDFRRVTFPPFAIDLPPKTLYNAWSYKKFCITAFIKHEFVPGFSSGITLVFHSVGGGGGGGSAADGVGDSIYGAAYGIALLFL